MQAVVLATEFQEWLAGETEKLPRSLLDVGGKPVIDHLLAFFSAAPAVETIHVRTNALYHPFFKEWLRGCRYMGKVELSSNGAMAPEDDPGIVAELESICTRKRFKKSILLSLGGSIFNFPIGSFIDCCARREGDVVAVTSAHPRHVFRGGGLVTITSNDRVIDFREDPSMTDAELSALPLYRMSAESIPFVKKYLMAGNDCDSLASFFAWSYRRRPLFACVNESPHYQLADGESYARVRALFEKAPR
ncbi:MAG: hypothetical protein JW876_04545 [Candidatus Krumholzibacteriota bacterium]|nr:hypothetical protein [Candidatus Krumholzibacteriota bacterium]